jgi:hypothetical protein
MHVISEISESWIVEAELVLDVLNSSSTVLLFTLHIICCHKPRASHKLIISLTDHLSD